jgi:hypothetical protein
VGLQERRECVLGMSVPSQAALDLRRVYREWITLRDGDGLVWRTVRHPELGSGLPCQ